MIRLGIKDKDITEVKLPAEVTVLADCASSSNCLKLDPYHRLEKRKNATWLVKTKPKKNK